jgi:hypothetical protein
MWLSMTDQTYKVNLNDLHVFSNAGKLACGREQEWRA